MIGFKYVLLEKRNCIQVGKHAGKLWSYPYHSMFKGRQACGQILGNELEDKLKSHFLKISTPHSIFQS